MTKSEKAEHQQKVINSLNSRLNEIEDMLARTDNPFQEGLLEKQKQILTRRLANLYGTEKYGFV